MNNDEKISNLANEVIKLAKDNLIVKLRFLDMAISLVELIEDKSVVYLASGFGSFIYNPKSVLKAYKEDKNKLNHDYLHIILHNVFHHNYVGKNIDLRLWNLASDMAIEEVISSLDIKSLLPSNSLAQRIVLDILKEKGLKLTAEKIYTYLINCDFDERKLVEYEKMFFVDDHLDWTKKEVITQEDITNNQELWNKVSNQILEDLRTFNKQAGNNKSSLIDNLLSVTKEKYDYYNFLRKFMVIKENMVIDDEQFDYIYYSYGLSLFKNVPLVEPLEYKESKAIYDLAIIIDTSGSVDKSLVRAFLFKTYSIISSGNNFFRKFNLHLIQVDNQVQSDELITSIEELENYISNIKIKGFGGTDFVSGINYVNKLVEHKAFNKLKGIIYFTDGYGDFPKKKPDYDVAFLFIENDYNDKNVPSWAIKIILDNNDLKEMKDEY